jgi:hypothetical protein
MMDNLLRLTDGDFVELAKALRSNRLEVPYTAFSTAGCLQPLPPA